ncbi:hypothetical protein BACCAP_01238 [Pseudoflavonifractor capillosus ATCC 29799]|uniref:Uncharacterized protein n=1 Tax=Pseudoflavonifractor capillosus ATCC 29799 TaxID=411467 RepID=A6NSQ9_9FIRM|nr:hypothetical protein BACCAP_01238 [Pseudoflavonifractor capillosus ATCC 29799]
MSTASSTFQYKLDICKKQDMIKCILNHILLEVKK